MIKPITNERLAELDAVVGNDDPFDVTWDLVLALRERLRMAESERDRLIGLTDALMNGGG